MRALTEIREEEPAIISYFTDPRVGAKLLSMGILPGYPIKILRKTARGKTFYVKVGDNRFAIRKKEAACIVLK
ncbi:MAG TPA: ferrous iron transport protein A [Phaeodactylibacter sp.]|nr:ferrous iron transport protein A [Phaeodactylibacter sp.]